MKDILSIILGGGKGSRLYPLTKYRAKPAVPIVGKYRLIDIPISNCLNSGFEKIFILTQFESGSLNRHIFRSYKLDYFSGGFVEIIAAEQSLEENDWFQGSADAVRKCLKHFSHPSIEYILVLSGDQLYKMNFADLLRFHIKKNAQISIACNSVAVEETSDLGIMGIDSDCRIENFIEKPKTEKEIKSLLIKVDDKERYLASMGIYLFNKDVLSELLTKNNKADFGREIIPDALSVKRTYAFTHNGYWKDIGSIKSFYEESLAFTQDNPPLDFFNESWQFFTRPRYLPLTRISDSRIEKSNVAEGAIIEKADIAHSIIGLRSIVRSESVIEDSILMGNDFYEQASLSKINLLADNMPLGIGRNCHIKKAIIDKNVRIGDNVKIINRGDIQEFENEYCVIRNGIVIIPKNTVIPSGSII